MGAWTPSSFRVGYVFFPSQIGYMPTLHLSYLAVNTGIFHIWKDPWNAKHKSFSWNIWKRSCQIPHLSWGRGPGCCVGRVWALPSLERSALKRTDTEVTVHAPFLQWALAPGVGPGPLRPTWNGRRHHTAVWPPGSRGSFMQLELLWAWPESLQQGFVFFLATENKITYGDRASDWLPVGLRGCCGLEVFLEGKKYPCESIKPLFNSLCAQFQYLSHLTPSN